MTSLAVTGSTGHIGGQVAHLVADLRPRLIVRDPSRAPELAGARRTTRRTGSSTHG